MTTGNEFVTVSNQILYVYELISLTLEACSWYIDATGTVLDTDTDLYSSSGAHTDMRINHERSDLASGFLYLVTSVVASMKNRNGARQFYFMELLYRY
jgi:hypothetical protein